MITEQDLNRRIFRITVEIQEDYPELYNSLSEMYATLPVVERHVINRISLNNWLESLHMLLVNYNTAKHAQVYPIEHIYGVI